MFANDTPKTIPETILQKKILIRNMKQRPHENESLLNASLYLDRVAGALSEHPDNPKSADDPN